MITPPYLQKGDTIAIVAPAGKISKERIIPSVEILKRHGFRVKLGEHIFNTNFQFAGTNEQRLEDLQKALNDVSVKAILCARGGYGTIHLINKLNFYEFTKSPKWLIGFSDITILHNQLNNLGFSSIHGPMATHFNLQTNNNESVEQLLKLISGATIKYQTEAHQLNRHGETSAEIVGGNLAILYSLLGTKFDIETAGKILFIEDIGEYLYNIDRMIHSLKLAGKFEKLSGLIVGDFSDVKDNSTPFGKSAYKIIDDAVSKYNFPICYGFPSGHEKKNLPLILGNNWKLEVTNRGTNLITI
jgi:muramoyltetrapeptide carboxypeptidase